MIHQPFAYTPRASQARRHNVPRAIQNVHTLPELVKPYNTIRDLATVCKLLQQLPLQEFQDLPGAFKRLQGLLIILPDLA